jgi:hypothetical protein
MKKKHEIAHIVVQHQGYLTPEENKEFDEMYQKFIA